jgi:hypothetical protein
MLADTPAFSTMGGMCAHRTGAALLFLLPLLLACARATPLGEIARRGDELRGKHVTVTGEVIDTVDVPLLKYRYYHLDDGSGQLWVQTKETLPARGDHLQVGGNLTPGLHIPGLDVGLVLDEQSRE